MLVPAALSLGLFAWLADAASDGSGCTYAAYGGCCTSPSRWSGCISSMAET